ncbi:MAG: LemA family protein, partial [Flavobacteriaceae bacterium]|nr:LemA family protein [Flavobacteriaceae bacterium]
MKRWLPVIVIIGLLFLIGAYMAKLNNRLVGLDEGVNAQWSNVESTYQRRADLIPNIVNTA